MTKALAVVAVLVPMIAAADPEPTPWIVGRVRVYDFAPRALDDLTPALSPSPHRDTVDKAMIRAALREVQPELIDCLRSTPGHGTLELNLHVVATVDTPSFVEDATVGGDLKLGAAAKRCVREALLAMDMPVTRETAKIEVDVPFTR